MKPAWIKAFAGKLAATGALLLFLVLVPSAAAGMLPLWAVLLLGAAGVLVLNAACGVLLPEEHPERQPAARPREVPLRVVRGGRAA